MAKSVAQFVNDIRTYISKGKVKNARKTLEKAQKASMKGPSLKSGSPEKLNSHTTTTPSNRHTTAMM